MNSKVVITGTGLVSALGANLEETWNALLEGQCGVRAIEGFDASGFACRTAAEARVRVLGSDQPVAGIQPRLAGVMGTHLALLVRASREAFGAACLDESVPPEERGFFAGMGMVDYNIDDLLPGVRASRDGEGRFDPGFFYGGGYREIYPLWPLGMLNNVSFCGVSIDLDARGENTVFSSHADAGAWAVAEGAQAVADGRVRVALAGGVSEQVSPLSLMRGLLAGTLREEPNGGANPAGAGCLPFSAGRCGSVLGEAAGMMILESIEGARERGVQPLAVVVGFGAAFGVEEEHGKTVPTAAAIFRAMDVALRTAGVCPEEVDLVMAHADGTERGDRHEAAAIGKLFASRRETVRVYASKGALGHLYAASPAVDVVLAVEMMRRGVVPGTVTALPLDESVGFRLLQGASERFRPKRVLINACSGEGQCASLLLEVPLPETSNM